MSIEEDKALITEMRVAREDAEAAHDGDADFYARWFRVRSLCDLAERLMQENAELQEWGERCQKAFHERGAIIDRLHAREHKLQEEVLRLTQRYDALSTAALKEINQ